jgi:hypothetical protein
MPPATRAKKATAVTAVAAEAAMVRRVQESSPGTQDDCVCKDDKKWGVLILVRPSRLCVGLDISSN